MTRFALILLGVSSVVGSVCLAAPPASQPEPTPLRVGAFWYAKPMLDLVERELATSRPDIMVERTDAPGLTGRLPWIDDLAAGRIDVAVYHGRLAGPGRPAAALESLRAKGCLGRVVAWRAMAVAVHPRCPATQVDFDAINRVLNRNGSWANLGWPPGKAVKLQVESPASIGLSVRFSDYFRYVDNLDIPKALDQAAADETSVYLGVIQPRLTSSGMRLLPLSSPQSAGQPVVPTGDAVLSGRYPYGDYLLVATRPNPSPPATAYVAAFESPRLTRALAVAHYVRRPDYASSPTIANEIWPAPQPPAGKLQIAGAVAILPVQPMSRYFKFADSAHYGVYEQAVADGIGRDGRLAMVDRTELGRVLTERQLELLNSTARPSGPLVAADVLITLAVVTEGSKSFVQIKAVHAPMATCIGLLKLAIDPARPEAFDPPLEQTVVRWWPGVLANLASVRGKPVWTVLPGANEPGPAGARAAARRLLMDSSVVFFADSTMLPDAQRELLMKLTGLSRADGKFVSTADYAVDCRPVEGAAVSICIVRGRDGLALAETTIREPGIDGQSADWLNVQLKRFTEKATNQPGDRPVGAAGQFALELRRAQELCERWESFVKEADERRNKARSPQYSKEDWARLNKDGDEMIAAFARACQLDPTSSDAAWMRIDAMRRVQYVCRRNQYAYCLQFAEIARGFVETFPTSPHADAAAAEAGGCYHLLLRAVEEETMSTSYFMLPEGVDRGKMSKQFRRERLRLRARWFTRNALPKGGSRRDEYLYVLKDYVQQILLFSNVQFGDGAVTRTLATATDAEMDEVLAEYSKALDKHKDVALHSDFIRLTLLANKKDNAAFVKLLGAMQARWPDPNDPHWKLGGEQVVEQLVRLFRKDKRGLSFGQWLSGQGPAGSLP